MWKLDTLLMGAATLLLLVVNGLAFHDYQEVHTVRDWLMLLASGLVLIQFARVFWQQNVRRQPADAA